jgi:hypothetical protein
MFYTFIVLFEKSSTLIDLMDLCKDFISKRRKVTNLALTGWGCYREREKIKSVRERERRKSEIIRRSLFCRPYYFVDNLLLIKLFFNGLLFRRKKKQLLFLFYKIIYYMLKVYVEKKNSSSLTFSKFELKI